MLARDAVCRKRSHLCPTDVDTSNVYSGAHDFVRIILAGSLEHRCHQLSWTHPETPQVHTCLYHQVLGGNGSGQGKDLVRGCSLEGAAGATALQAAGIGGRSCCARLFGDASEVLVHPLLLRAEVACLGPEGFR